MKKIKLRQVNHFSKSADAFAVVFHPELHWGSAGLATHCPLSFSDKDGFLGAISWEMNFGVFLNTTKNDELIDLSIVAEAKPVKDNQEVEVTSNNEGVGKYDREKDVLMEKQNKEVTASIDVGKGVYLLLNENEYIGVLVKNAKKKYDSLIDEIKD